MSLKFAAILLKNASKIMSNNISQLYDQWLSDYQPDLVKIVGKHHYNGKHAISAEEVISEVNFRLIKDKDKLIKERVVDLTSFKQIAYSYARNLIKWTADGVTAKDKKYFNNRSDGIISTDDGEKTLFDYVSETLGEEDPSFRELNASQKVANIQKWIFNYSHFLSDRQKNVMHFVFKGKKLIEIGEALGVTHQAISLMVDDALSKIKSHLKPETLLQSEKDIIKSGRDSINYLFGPRRKKHRSQFNTMLKKCN